MAERIFTKDTALVESQILDEDGVNTIPVASAAFELTAPSGQQLIVSSLPADPAEGTRVALSQPSGGFDQWDVVEWDGATWTRLESMSAGLAGDVAVMNVPGSLTAEAGNYRGRIQFTTPDSIKKSNLVSFEAVDPLEPFGSDVKSGAIKFAWTRFEDLFDSELGGPWLRDKTLKSFDPTKMAKLLPDAIYYVNYTWQPVTTFNEDSFPYEAHTPLAGQALVVASIRHLMRSYVEQPQPVGATISYFDRRDYLQRWGEILKIEKEMLDEWLNLWKMAYMNFGEGALLVGGYASGIYRTPAALRTRYPRWPAYYARGW